MVHLLLCIQKTALPRLISAEKKPDIDTICDHLLLKRVNNGHLWVQRAGRVDQSQ